VTEKPKLLVVDDDEAIRTQMKWAFSSDYEVLLAEDRATAAALVRSDLPPVVTLDLGLPPKPHDPSEGIRALSEILEAHPSCKVIVITGQEERDNALHAIAQGAYDFFTKPIRIAELEIVVRRALQVYRLEEENRTLPRRAMDEPFEDMLGSSRAMQEVFTTIRKAAPSDSAVLVTGETGTGKELTARALHHLSERRAGPFVPINCGAIPGNLLEAELFGHEKGAFTDAHMQRKGRVELAHGGTLFLDEIGELSPNLQVALLRYLQEGKLQRVGGRTDISVDARLIAATNADLAAAIREGEFREDLYYRLSVVVIRLPPLREREEDVSFLANAMLQRYSASNRKKITGFTNGAQEAIKQHAWPGNIRELENRIKRAVIMSTGPKITPADLELDSQFARYERKGLKYARAELARELIEKAMARHGGNFTQVAAELGVSRPTLYELIDKLGIEKKRADVQKGPHRKS
jgi:two-component system NtrC family response regulator